ncbi:MAG: radical SAM protein [Alphaproteobacteria bacterium]|nr:radical SAM protein [Alphaproteobacteria bacterium]
MPVSPALAPLSTPPAAPVRKSRPYVFLGQTTSLCETCLALVPAKIIEQGEAVYYLKRCPAHGVQKTLISSEAHYWKRCRDFLKPGDVPLRFHTRIDKGCPYDCGLCPDHEQHSCLALIEVNEHCNLKCPICFADSSPARTGQRSLAEIEAMLDLLVDSEGQPDLLQISGGEPTLHPQILDILQAARRRPIRHVMLNTNGIRLSGDPDFVAALAEMKRGFEVYLQFDALSAAALQTIRGADLRRVRERALDALDAAGISTTLVCVIRKGVNDSEIGDVLRYAQSRPCVRGVTFQPVQDAGRNDDFDPRRDRIVLSQIRRAIIDQWGVFGEDDLIPLPCNPEAISIGYGLRVGAQIRPLTHLFPQEVLVQTAPNAVTLEADPQMRNLLVELLSLSCAGQQSANVLREVLCCLPLVEVPAQIGYDRVFRVTVVSFLDRFNFCLAGVKRSCIHFVTADQRIIPFDTYNMFHRAGLAGPMARAAL